MKRCFKFLILMGMIIVLSASKSFDSEEEGKKPIKLTQSELLQGDERSVSVSVSAELDIHTYLIDLNIYGLEHADIYILDNNGEVVNHESLSFESFLQIAVSPVSGTYWIVIDSGYYYAEGVFVL